MSVTPRIGLRQGQRLALTPAMRGALHLLCLPTALLAEELAREAEENPFLEIAPRAGGAPWETEPAAAPDSLPLSLARQIALEPIDPQTRAAALTLIGCLREDGYLDQPLDEIAAESGLDADRLSRGLAALQACDPAGVAARNLAECLELQLIDRGCERDLARAVCRHLDDFAHGRIASLARALGLPRDRIQGIAADLARLSPAPAAPDDGWAPPLVAELVVERRPDGAPEVALNARALPVVRVTDLGSESKGLADWLGRARAVTNALAARSATLLRIGRHIVATQDAFFRGDRAGMRPQSRAAAAEALGLHPSTLGRALAGKALLADGEAHALSRFFSRALPGPEGQVSAYGVRARIRALIAAEDRAAPLADDEICARLNDEGVDIARRTVAKYRKCMRIPTSFERRRRTAMAATVPPARPK